MTQGRKTGTGPGPAQVRAVSVTEGRLGGGSAGTAKAMGPGRKRLPANGEGDRIR